MSWFNGSSSVSAEEFEEKIISATSESIPNGEIDLAVALELTDDIRGKKISPIVCVKILRKRLTLAHNSPLKEKQTVSLLDVCIKNSGNHFLSEVASKEFIDFFILIIFKTYYDTKNPSISRGSTAYEVGELILKLISEWAKFAKDQPSLSYVANVYNRLHSEGYYPDDPSPFSRNDGSALIESDSPPDWLDGDDCLFCYEKFSMLNRKHHCRACGGVYCTKHSSYFIPLRHLGISDPVRVCISCYDREKRKEDIMPAHQNMGSRTENIDSDTDEDLRKAIELSLKETQIPLTRPEVPPNIQPNSHSTNNDAAAADDDDDEEMKKAIAASLQEFKAKEKLYQDQQETNEADYYSNLLPQTESLNDIEHSKGYNNVTSSKQPYKRPQAQVAQPPPSSQDLTPAEEESINLFVTLMNNVKNDPQKRSTIMYDNKLNELHGNILQLKPKLNISLRAAIEKYDAFLELNNKVSTITRLYDSYLEQKLSEAYGKHNIAYTQTPVPSQQQQQRNYDSYFSAPSQQIEQDTGVIDGRFQNYQATGQNIAYGSCQTENSNRRKNSQYNLHNYATSSSPNRSPDQVVFPPNGQSENYSESHLNDSLASNKYNHHHYHSNNNNNYFTEPTSEFNYDYKGNTSKSSRVQEREKFSYPMQSLSNSQSEGENEQNESETKFSDKQESRESKIEEANGSVSPYPKNDFIYKSFPSEPEMEGSSNKSQIEQISNDNSHSSPQNDQYSRTQARDEVPEDENEVKVAAKFPTIDEVNTSFPAIPRSKPKKIESRYEEEPLIEL